MSLLLALTDSVAPVTGTVAFTEGNDTAAAAATYGPTASAAYTEGNDTAAATAAYGPTASAAYTEGNDTAAAAATYGPTASIAFTEADDTIAATGFGGTVVADVDSGSHTGGHPTPHTPRPIPKQPRPLPYRPPAPIRPIPVVCRIAWVESDDGFSAAATFVAHDYNTDFELLLMLELV